MQIQNLFTGTEKEQNLAHLETIYQESKETLANSYSNAVGDFYESFGSSDEKHKMYQSMLSGIDKRVWLPDSATMLQPKAWVN